MLARRPCGSLVHNVNFRGLTWTRSLAVMDLYDFHQAAQTFAASVITRLDTAMLERPSAIGWTVAELVRHLAAVNALCANAADAIGPEQLGTSGVLPEKAEEEPVEAWQRTAAAFTGAFAASADNLEVLMPTPLGEPYPGWVVLTQGSLENLVHTWDMTPVLGTPVALPADLVTEALARILEQGDLYRKFRDFGMYAEPVPPSPHATPQQRLLGYLGRK
jgi:uncharacterized protein (TIGR03086 family)